MKYKFINGVPYCVDDNDQIINDLPLAVVATPDDVINMNKAGGTQLQMPLATVTAVDYFNSPQPNFTAQYGSPQPLDSQEIFRKITAIFSQQNVPIGLLSKLLDLGEYNLKFLVDDSTSMNNPTEAKPNLACDYMRQTFAANKQSMSRWDEAEDILHIMIGLLAYVPTGLITILFLNRTIPIVLDRRGLTPDQFAATSHAQVRAVFSEMPTGSTPLYTRISESLNGSYGNTMHYILTDGVPSDETSELKVSDLIKRRNNSKNNPVTLLGCTDKLNEIEWMEDLEGAEHMAVVNYYPLEKLDILEEQGRMFPYTKGMWLLGILVAAISPDDLGDLGSGHPLSRSTLTNLMGRSITHKEYRKYWLANPNHLNYMLRYNDFANLDLSARRIIAAMQSESIFTSVKKLFTSCMPMHSFSHFKQQQEAAPAQEETQQQQAVPAPNNTQRLEITML